MAGLAGLALSASPAAAESVSRTAEEEERRKTRVAATATAGETIEVTGRARKVESPKFTAPVEEMPQTVTIIPKEIFTEQGARNLTDILRNTPGITFNAGENAFGSGLTNFSLRGFDTSGSIFIDGVRDSGSYARDSFNIEQVEVVKGPSGDNGRGTAGGYVNIVTKRPLREASYAGELSYGLDEYDSRDRVRATFDVNHPFTDGAAVRVNALWEDSGVPGRDVAALRSVGIAPSVAFGMDTPTRVTLSLQYVEQEDRPDWGVPAALIKGTLRYDPTLDADSLRDKYYGLAADFDDVSSLAVLARLEHSLTPDIELSTQFRWSSTDRDASFTLPSGYDPATRLVTTMRLGYARENTTLASLTNVTAEFETGSLRHTLSAGLEVTWDEASAFSFPSQTNPGTVVPISIFDPDPRRAGRTTIAPTQASEVDVSTVAIYVFDTIELSPSWQLTGGLRAEHYEVEIDNETLTGVPLGPDGLDISETTLSGRIGLVYEASDDLNLYAAVGVASQPPASFLSNTDISREGDNAFPGYSAGINSEDAKVQRSINYEIGAKWELLDDRLLATAALFRTERQNVAITGRDPGVTPTPPVELLGYGKQIVQGIELGIAGRITPEWEVFGGILFMDSERKHSEFLDAARRLANPADYGAVLRTSGDSLAFTPDVSANLWTTYTLPVGLTIGGGVQYVGSSWVGRPDDAERIIPNGASGKLPSYWVLNAVVDYEVTPEVSVRLNMDNLTDELYAASINWSAQRVLLGPSRSFLLSLNVKL